jgi:predicted O-methyltransferase YrrM
MEDLMFFTPELSRGWQVVRSFEDSQGLVSLLSRMENNPHKDGRSDIGVHNLLYALALNLRPRRILEVGTHIGVASVVIATALRRNGYGKLFTIEPQPHYAEIAAGYIQDGGLEDYVEIVSGFFGDATAQRRLREEIPFDIIYIDASHTKADAAHDIRLSLDMLRDNGLVILHDTGIASPEFDQTGQGGVRRALWEYNQERPEYPVIFFEYPLWLNTCGAALICKQKLYPPPV